MTTCVISIMKVLGTIAIHTMVLYAVLRLRRRRAIAMLIFCNPTAIILIGSAKKVNLSAVRIWCSVRYSMCLP